MARVSANIYDTFGNEIKYSVTQNKLVNFLENATVQFPLPEASAFILQSFLDPADTVDPVMLDQVYTKLVSIGYGEPAAKAMGTVLIKVAKQQGVSPLQYFDDNQAQLKLAIDSYEAMNALRPAGNRVGLNSPINNQKSRQAPFIKP
tara:strand:+ start:95 stop:535 length:441 start_codon:yes stop_codon:yes gene_type:complete